MLQRGHQPAYRVQLGNRPVGSHWVPLHVLPGNGQVGEGAVSHCSWPWFCFASERESASGSTNFLSHLRPLTPLASCPSPRRGYPGGPHFFNQNLPTVTDEGVDEVFATHNLGHGVMVSVSVGNGTRRNVLCLNGWGGGVSVLSMAALVTGCIEATVLFF